MTPKWRYLALAAILALPLSIVFTTQNAVTSPKDVELTCRINPITTPLFNDSIVIPVYMANYTDSVAGFELWVSIANPDLIRFVDTTIGGTSHGKVDTVGTLWSSRPIAPRVLDPFGGLLKVSGLVLPPPYGAGAVPPGSSGILVKLIAKTNGTLGDSVCGINIETILSKTQTRFTDTKAELIGYNIVWLVDTTYVPPCLEYHGDTCVAWQDTTYDSTRVALMDTTKLVLLDGKIRVKCWECADADASGAVDISDAVYVIAFIFNGGTPPNPLLAGDANCDQTVDISDAVYLIAYIFAGGPAPCAGC